MYDHAVGSPLGAFTTASTGVAMVMLGSILTLSVVLVGCSFFSRKVRSGKNDGSSEAPPGIYVAESYANPAFLELPFDGSCTSSVEVPYDLSIPANISIHTTTHQTTSKLSPGVTLTCPGSVVAKMTGPVPYQEEPDHYVQGNPHLSVDNHGTNSAINVKEGETVTRVTVGGQGDFPRSHEQVSTDTVYANQGAEMSFSKLQTGGDPLESTENLQKKEQSKDVSVPPLHSSVDIENNSPKVIENNSTKCELPALQYLSKEGNEGCLKGNGVINARQENLVAQCTGGKSGPQHKGGRKSEGRRMIECSAKRLRVSADSLNTPRENGISQRQRKKPKMSPESDPESTGHHVESPGKNRVKRKGSRNSSGKARKPPFHPKKVTKKQPKIGSTAEVVIRNDFVS